MSKTAKMRERIHFHNEPGCVSITGSSLHKKFNNILPGGRRKFLRLMKLCLNLTVLVVTQIHKCVKIHRPDMKRNKKV